MIHEITGISGEWDIFIPDMIIAGGQTGADMGGLLGAEACGIATGGIAPRGWLTERGPQPELGSRFGLVESKSDKYDIRTAENVGICNAVILIAAKFDSPGSKLTKKLALACWRGCFDVPFPRLESLNSAFFVPDIKTWLATIRPGILMIAGNRESKAPGIENWTAQLIYDIFH